MPAKKQRKKTPGVPLNDGSGGGTGNAGHGCNVPTKTRKGKKR